MNKLVEELSETVREQIKKAFIAGIDKGAIITCAVIYKVCLMRNLPEDDILYTILQDIAKEHNGGEVPEEIGQLISNLFDSIK